MDSNLGDESVDELHWATEETDCLLPQPRTYPCAQRPNILTPANGEHNFAPPHKGREVTTDLASQRLSLAFSHSSWLAIQGQQARAQSQHSSSIP